MGVASRALDVRIERYPIAGSFVISRGAKTEAEVVTVTLRQNGATGHGECVPYARYGESLQSVASAIEAVRVPIESGAGRNELLSLMPAGAARNAVDCALWDLEAKIGGRQVRLGTFDGEPTPLITAMTISIGTPEDMAAQAKQHAHRPLLKVKVGREGDAARIRAVVSAAPRSRIILDANEGWTPDNIESNLDVAAQCGVALVEQPLPAGGDAQLAAFAHPVPICADESVHGVDDLAALVGRYDAVNIKLDKTGGLTAALVLEQNARDLGFSVMVGCMVGTSLAMAPAVLLAQRAEYVDLDGPLLLARDRQPSLLYEGSLVHPPKPELWG